MIVRRTGDTLHLITQPDHARLAARVMERCGTLADHPRRDTILFAIAEHDTGWAGDDAAPRVDRESGAVLDFIHAPTSVRQGAWPRCVELIAPENTYAAALIAQHALTVYDRLRTNVEWQAFFAEMLRRRDALLATSGESLDHLLTDYAYLRLGDLISLAFCTGSMDLNQFGVWHVSRTDGCVVIEPDIFDGAVIPIEVGARTLPAQRWRDDDALRAALREAPVVTLKGLVSGQR